MFPRGCPRASINACLHSTSLRQTDRSVTAFALALERALHSFDLLNQGYKAGATSIALIHKHAVTASLESHNINCTAQTTRMAQSPSLTGPWLNAEQVLYESIPDLLIGGGPGRPETTTRAGTPKLSYIGPLAKWDTLHQSVWDFVHDRNTLNTARYFDRCKHLPVSPDPKVQTTNPHATTREHVQVGAEITLSGRFFERVLVPVSAVVSTLTDVTMMRGRPADRILPTTATSGDSWIVAEPLRPDRDSSNKKQPDVVLKFQVGRDNLVRLTGELKFCTTVRLKEMVDNAIDPYYPRLLKFSNILGKFHDAVLCT